MPNINTSQPSQKQSSPVARINRKFRSWRRRWRVFRWVQRVRRDAICLGSVFINGEGVIKGNDLVIENNVHIGSNYFIHSSGGIRIGENTHISQNFACYSCNHQYEGNCLPYDNQLIRKPVEIGKNVWIGMNVSMCPGVQIGDGAIIGLGSVVTKDVPSCAIVGGNPAKILKYRNTEHYDNLIAQKKYGGVNGSRLQHPE